MTTVIRFMEKKDLQEVEKCEELTYLYIDEDLGVPQLPKHAWRIEDLLEIARQYKDKAADSNDTRLLVAVDNVNKDKVFGAIAYEITENGYTILLLTVKPDAPDNTFDKLLQIVYHKASNSKTRKLITIHIPDGNWKQLKFFQDTGFTVKLVPNFYIEDLKDAWCCTLRVH